MLSNAHAAGSDAIKVGLIGCGGRGTRRGRQHLRGRGHELQHQAACHGRRLRRPPQELPRVPPHQRQLQGEVRRPRRSLLRRVRRLSEGHRLLRPGDAGDPARASGPCTSRRPSRPASTSSPRSRSPSTAPASARCWPPTRMAKTKGLSRRRRHPAPPSGALPREPEADPRRGHRRPDHRPGLLEPGGHLGRIRARRTGATPSTRSATGITSSGSAATTSSSSTSTTSTSPSGPWAPTRSAPSAWAAARFTPSPSSARATTTSPSITSSPMASTS